jgi:hypothetical protein
MVEIRALSSRCGGGLADAVDHHLGDRLIIGR